MSLVLYGHPFSSYTQKALIALYENGTKFEFEPRKSIQRRISSSVEIRRSAVV